MKNNFINRIVIIIAFILAVFNGPSSNAWGGDLNVNPTAGRLYTQARITVAYDGTIYLGRFFSLTGGSINRWEILRSTDNGGSFSPFKDGMMGSVQTLTSFDLMAVGSASTFQLIMVRGVLDTVNSEASIILSRFDAGGNYIAGGSIEDNIYSSTPRGYTSLCLASDWKDPNVNASLYSVSLVAAKAGSFDSVIVWTDNSGGSNFTRRSLIGTPGYIKSVSCAIGKASSSGYGRLAITWDDFAGFSDEWGTPNLMYIYPDDATDATDGGPYQLLPVASGRNTHVALSQNGSLSDIHTLVVLDTDGGGAGINTYFIRDYRIINNTPTFNSAGTFGLMGDQVNGYTAYNAITDSFMVTYFDAETLSMVYARKDDAGLMTGVFDEIKADYRDANTNVSAPMPRVDALDSGRVFFVWNEDDLTWFDGESIWPTSVQSVASNLQEMKLYPNPATDNITLTFTAEQKDDATLIITDISGKVVHSAQANITVGNNQIPVMLNNLPAGNYILRIAGSHTNTSVMFTIKQ